MVINTNKLSIESRLIGKSKAIQDIRRMILQMSQADSPTLISGESGVGKELVARLIHYHSNRANAPFVIVNIGAIPNQLATSELFGHTKGAFTGSIRDMKGRIELTHGGTLVIDGIENAPPEIQRGLTRFLDTSKVSRLGEIESRKVDVRLIATTIYQYSELFKTRTVIIDLLSRFANKVIYIPPLRERTGDIPVLLKHFLMEIKKEQGVSVELSSIAKQALQTYDYPGNVRELCNILERAAVLAKGGVIAIDDLGLPAKAVKSDDNDALRTQLDLTRRELETLKRTTIAADPVWEGRWFPAEGDYCFVLMPFAEIKDIQRVYQDHVKIVLEKRCGLRCERADDIYDISGVMQSVWEGINRARLIIADLTGRNPNVFYELGIAHTLGKPVIMLTQSMDYVPFDLRHLRCIVYEYKPSRIEKFENDLERTVRRILSSSATELSQVLQQD